MIDENKFKSEIESLIPKDLLQKIEKHPLHMLDNQIDLEKRQSDFLSKNPKVIVSQKPIRTYEGDVADALSNKKNSVMTMAIAEQEKTTKTQAFVDNELLNQESSQKTNQKTYENRGNTKKILIIIISLIFIGSGIAGGYYLYLKSPIAPDTYVQPIIKIPSLISPDTQKIVMIDSLTGDRLSQFISNKITNENIIDEKILELIPAKSFASTTIRVTGSQFIDDLKLSMPDILKRSLTDRWMLGIYSSNDQKLPFIALSTDFFQNAFAGMLKWESTMPDELAIILGYTEKARNNDIGTTSIASYYNIKGTFRDKIIKNRDIREFLNSRGEILFLYTFLNQNTLIITTSEATLYILIDRIEKQTYIR